MRCTNCGGLIITEHIYTSQGDCRVSKCVLCGRSHGEEQKPERDRNRSRYALLML
ncbi:MAG: hypothetical protein ACE5HN_10665 [Nitrospiria bacterium]